MIDRLKEYIEKDEIYQNYKKGDLPNPSDFEQFCIQHCEDINYLLSLLKLYSGTLHREHIAIHRANDLEDEYEELKSNYDRIYNENCKLREDHNINDISLLDENYKLKERQQAFIEYLTSFIGLLNNNPDFIEESQRDILEEVLTKFKEIIGKDINVNSKGENTDE